jgi:hypothetical protein
MADGRVFGGGIVGPAHWGMELTPRVGLGVLLFVFKNQKMNYEMKFKLNSKFNN